MFNVFFISATKWSYTVHDSLWLLRVFFRILFCTFFLENSDPMCYSAYKFVHKFVWLNLLHLGCININYLCMLACTIRTRPACFANLEYSNPTKTAPSRLGLNSSGLVMYPYIRNRYLLDLAGLPCETCGGNLPPQTIGRSIFTTNEMK